MTQKGKFHMLRKSHQIHQQDQTEVLSRINIIAVLAVPHFRATMCMRTPRQRPPETRSSSPVCSLLFCLLVSSFVFFCQVFVLLRVCSELFRKDPLRILVLVPPCTPLHPSGHLRCRSLPSSTGPRSVTRVFRPVSGAVLTILFD